jgi:hypothetical protein
MKFFKRKAGDEKMDEKQPVWFGQLKLTILGGLTMLVDEVFTITPDRAKLLEKKILKVLAEFVDEA